jgi:hypothetical protein
MIDIRILVGTTERFGNSEEMNLYFEEVKATTAV